jgi:hypothetical protein
LSAPPRADSLHNGHHLASLSEALQDAANEKAPEVG